MGSLKECENLKEELRSIILEGGSLEEEDVGLVTKSMKLEKPKDVLVRINYFKEEGNVFFKKGEEDNKVAFFALASNIILNIAMCFLKKKEFLQVGQLCTIDLSLASEVEPSNQEVENKLNHVNNLLHNPSTELTQDTCSDDLDLNPSLPRNSPVGRILKVKGNHVVGCEMGARNDKNEVEAPPKSNKRKFINQDVVVNGLVKGDSSIEEGNQMGKVARGTKDVVMREVMNNEGEKQNYNW
ncbi:Mono [ADP-ribose] polymerase PARP16 [Bienertia sinuspersici]